MTRLIVRIPGRGRGRRWAIVGLLTCVAFGLFTIRLAVAAEVSANTGPQEEAAAQKYWSDRERGWFWYQVPPSEQEQKPKTTPPAAVTPRVEPARSPELLEFDALQKRVEELRNIAIIRPTESNIRNYLAVQAEVIDKASLFADVAQRVIWANPEFDYTVTGRPVNAKALEVFDRAQIDASESAAMALAKDHALFFFFRSDCPYCHQFGPYLREFEAKFGLTVVPISVDGGPLLPVFPNPKIDNGIARALDVREVPALFLVEPRGGKIVPIGYGVLSESELLERLASRVAAGHRQDRAIGHPIRQQHSRSVTGGQHEPSSMAATLDRSGRSWLLRGAGNGQLAGGQSAGRDRQHVLQPWRRGRLHAARCVPRPDLRHVHRGKHLPALTDQGVPACHHPAPLFQGRLWRHRRVRRFLLAPGRRRIQERAQEHHRQSPRRGVPACTLGRDAPPWPED